MSTPRNHIVVMKFGGTSVEDATAIQRTAAIVVGHVRKGLSPIVIVSAMSKVTDTLLAAAAAAGRNAREEALKLSDTLRTRHLNTAAELVTDPDSLTSLQLNIHHEFDTLDDLLRGISAVGELTPRTSDNVVSFGERLSSVIVAAAFVEAGIVSAHTDARTVILTDDHYGKAAPNEPAIEAAAHPARPPPPRPRPRPRHGRLHRLPQVPGAEAGITTTLGRGGSDYTAALVGGGLHAGAIEIWTDVNGIMTTDPRIVPEALRVKTISFEEAAELAYFGAKVLHPATILPAVQKNIPVFVLNSRNAENEGTKITATPPPCASPFKSIAAKKKLTIIDIVASRMLLAHGFLKSVFDVFDKHHCAIDMVSTSEVSISVTVDSNQALRHLRRPGQDRRRQIRRQQSPHLFSRRRHPRHLRNLRPGLQRHLARKHPHDLPGRQRDQHELHDQRRRRRRGPPLPPQNILRLPRPNHLRHRSPRPSYG